MVTKDPSQAALKKLLVSMRRVDLGTPNNPSNSVVAPLVRLDVAREALFPASTLNHLYREIFEFKNTEASDGYRKQCVARGNPAYPSIVQGLVYALSAAKLYYQDKYVESREENAKAIRLLLSLDDTHPLPSSAAVIPCAEWTDQPFILVEAVQCALQCVRCATKDATFSRFLALEWIQEIHCMFQSYGANKLTASSLPAYPWKEVTLPAEEFIKTRLEAYILHSTLLSDLGNTAGAYALRWAGIKHGSQALSPRTIRALQEMSSPRPYLSMRHPDPATVGRPKVFDYSLQVRGAWKKLRVGEGNNGVPRSRLGAASVVWNGKYYIFGGRHSSHTTQSDSWVVDLRNLDRGWTRLSSGPWPADSDTSYFKCAIYRARAYMFMGSCVIPVFDFETQRWNRVRTQMADPDVKWATIFPKNSLTRYAVEVVKDVMYVFGGCHPGQPMGRNTLVALDLTTSTWKLLSGTVSLQPDVTLPGPREFPSSWVESDKLYIAYGDAGRNSSLIGGKPEGSKFDHTYEDIWSWDLHRSVWTQERVRGNAPCLRTEAGYTFNAKWNHTVVFGGYCATLNFQHPGVTNEALLFTYFGDTFIWSAETKSWSMVLSRGFPTWRAMGDLITDQDTGKTYLFGGYTNTEYTPSTRSSVAQSFNDLWELCVDVPNGGFDDDARAEFDAPDLRFTTVGPWRACFKCGSVGKWQSCSGSCIKTDQTAVFCSVECLKAGWAAHKRLNGCRKLNSG